MRLRRRYGGKIFASVGFAVSVVMAAFGFEAAPAVAQDYIPWFNDDQPRTEPAPDWKRRPRSPSRTVLNDYGRVGLKAVGERSAREAKPDEVPNPARPLFVIASIADQRVSVYNHHGLVARSAISTGMAGHPTPKGIFTIIGRERYHRSNIYSAAPCRLCSVSRGRASPCIWESCLAIRPRTVVSGSPPSSPPSFGG
jgi:L,D-transpeptidase catalytic domain